MAAANKDIVIEQDAQFTLQFVVQNSDGSPFNLTGYTADAQVRETATSKHSLATFSTSISTPTLGGPVIVSLNDAGSLAIPAGVFYWDFFIRNSGSSIRLLQGRATVLSTVSR